MTVLTEWGTQRVYEAAQNPDGAFFPGVGNRTLELAEADTVTPGWLEPTILASAFWAPNRVLDRFTTAKGAGEINGTAAEPGPDTRVVTDTESKLTISGGQLVVAGGKAAPANNDPWYRLTAITRAAGVTWLMAINSSAYSGPVFAGLDTGTATPTGACFKVTMTGLAVRTGGSSTDTIVIGALSNGMAYQFAITLRSSGAYYWIKGGAYTYWTLAWVDHTYTGTPLYPGVRNYAGVFVVDNFRLGALAWLPTPLLYDTFTRANGAIGSSETAGPDAQTTVARSWTSSVGTVAVSGNAAVASALSSGIAIATAETSTADVLHGAALTRGTGTPGIVVRYADASNYVYAVHTGTNAKLIKRVGGVETTLVDVAVPYAAGGRIVIKAAGSLFRLFYNGLLVGTVQTIADAGLQTGTKQGLYTTDTDSAMDNVLTFARGSANEYSALDAM